MKKKVDKNREITKGIRFDPKKRIPRKKKMSNDQILMRIQRIWIWRCTQM